jgi:hypothetical protein
MLTENLSYIYMVNSLTSTIGFHLQSSYIYNSLTSTDTLRT